MVILIGNWILRGLQEKVLEIEYIKVVAPGKQQDPLMHDDWVSAVDGSNPRFVNIRPELNYFEYACQDDAWFLLF